MKRARFRQGTDEWHRVAQGRAAATLVHCRPMAKPGKKKSRRQRRRHDPRRAEAAAQREEARRRVREERRQAAVAEEKRRRRRALLRRWATYAAVGIGVVALALFLFRTEPEVDGVTVPAEIEATQLAEGGTFDYGTATPTSGPYLPGEPECGVFPEEITPEQAATAVYHGAIVLWHRPDADVATIAALAAAAGEYDSQVVVSPNAAITDTVVATAWNRLLGFDAVDDGVGEFLDKYRGRGPGEADCPIRG